MKLKRKRQHPFQWLLEPAESEPSFFQKPMFGCQAIYLFGRLVLHLSADTEKPWNGVLVCRSREHHPPPLDDYVALRPHPVLGKWLYLAQAQDGFEETAQQLVEQMFKNDPRIGVEPRTRKRKRSS